MWPWKKKPEPVDPMKRLFAAVDEVNAAIIEAKKVERVNLWIDRPGVGQTFVIVTKWNGEPVQVYP